jgi:predicted lipid carrier protein YhbT
MRGLGERGRKQAGRRLPVPGVLTRWAPVFLLQPLVDRIVERMLAKHPDILARMGEKAGASILIDPVDMPFVLVLRPNPEAPEARILRRVVAPACDARVSASFLTLLRTIDARADADALFFSRDLKVGGDVEAVVRLRNAIDDVDGSIAADIAALHGRLGTAVLQFLRRRSEAA